MINKLQDFFESRREKKAEKAAKVVKNAKAIREDRWAALEYLADYSDMKVAIPGLLERFDFSLEHGINDTREKELAMKGITRFQKDALPYVRDKIKQSTRIAWPIKILKEIGAENDIIEVLKAGLDYRDVSLDQSAVDKNYDILCYLRDYQLGDEWRRIAQFLNDPDERVRFACVEALIEQKDDAVHPELERFLTDFSTENRRIRQAVLIAFLRKGWRLQRPDVFESGQVESGVYITPKGTLELRPH